MKIITCFSLLTFCLTAFAEEQTPSCYTLLENKELYPVLNPVLAERKTAKIVLQNGVRAYLVSDPKADRSAAAVCMEAGSWEDPEEYPGTAHFLEHMLFLGTTAYPDESEYAKYIQDNGGSINAFTASEKTVYMFSVNNDAFTGAFDRFSRFFIDPLFNPSCIARELRAVDQEFAKNLEHDGWRSYMVLKETGAQGHPNGKFSTGNAKTLSGIPQEVLREWYSTHYAADKMHVAAISFLPIEEMINLVTEKFSSVFPDKLASEQKNYGPLLSSEQKGHFLYIKPIKDLKVLSLVWELPEEFSNIDGMWTSGFISYIINNASDGSLFKKLKKDKLAESVYSFTDSPSRKNRLFHIDITLTEQGLTQVDTVISLCYQMLAGLKQTGIPLSLFREIERMETIKYQYRSKQDAFDWITEIASTMPDEDLSTFPEKTAIPGNFDQQAIHRLLSSLVPESCVYIILADPEKSGIILKSTEKWMQVPYSLEKIPESKLLAWKHSAPNPLIELPPANPFIPNILTLLNSESEEKGSLIIPEEVLKDKKGTFYFARDTEYLLPKVSYILNIKAPAFDGSAKAKVLLDLLCNTLDDKLSSVLFFAEQAGLGARIFSQNFGIALHISGYGDKAPELLEKVLESLQTASCEKAEFDLYKDSLLRSYSNESAEIPMRQALATGYNILVNNAPIGKEKEQALQNISFEEFLNFCKNFLSSVRAEGLFYGNLTKAQAMEPAKRVQKLLENAEIYDNPKKQNLLVLPDNLGPFKIMQNTERQGNGTVLVIEEGPFSFRKEASQGILASALQEAFYDTLRTKQQTGYMVYSWASKIDNQLLQFFAVQSSSHLPDNLLQRFEFFLEDFSKRLPEKISAEQFAVLKNTQITNLKVPPETMYDMALQLSHLAFEQNGDFTYKEKAISALQELTYEDFLKDAESFISQSNAKRLAVLVEGKQANEKPLRYAEIVKEDIVKIGTFSSL